MSEKSRKNYQKPNGEIKIVTTPRGNYNTISSMYIKDR